LLCRPVSFSLVLSAFNWATFFLFPTDLSSRSLPNGIHKLSYTVIKIELQEIITTYFISFVRRMRTCIAIKKHKLLKNYWIVNEFGDNNKKEEETRPVSNEQAHFRSDA
jgi:hypothetical protein